MTHDPRWRTVLRRGWLALLTTQDPWIMPDVDVTRPAVRQMIARARLDRRREAGAGIIPKYSRDPVIERRERKAAQMAPWVKPPASLFLRWKSEAERKWA